MITSNLSYKPHYRFALISAIVILLGLLLYRILLIFSYNGELGGIDNNFVYDVLRVISSGKLYTNPSVPPYAITLYAPLYYDLCYAMGKIVHINPDEAIQGYQLCRAVSLACDIATCITLFYLLRKRAALPNEIAALAIAAFASILCYLGYTFSRCDSLFLFFYGLFYYKLTGNPSKIRGILLLSLLSACCLFSKQNGLIVPILGITWLWLNNTRKAVLNYIISFLVISAALTLVHIYIFRHEYFIINVTKAVQNKIDPAWFYVNVFKRTMNSLWMLPLYGGLFFAIAWLKKPVGSREKTLGIIFIIQLLFSLGTSLKYGSSPGYFNENLFQCFLLISLVSLKIQENYRRIALFAVIPLLILFFIHTVTEGYLFFIQHTEEKQAKYEQQKDIRNWLRTQPGDHSILNTGTPNSDFVKTLFYKEVMVPNVDMVTCCTLPDGNFDYTSLKDDLEKGNIKYLIAPANISFNEFSGIPLTSYKQDTTFNGYIIYKFNNN